MPSIIWIRFMGSSCLLYWGSWWFKKKKSFFPSMSHEWALQSGFFLLITLISSLTSDGFISCFKLMYLKIMSFGGNTNFGKGWWYLCCNGCPPRFQQYLSLTEINRTFFIRGIAIRPERIRLYNSYYLTGTSLSFTGKKKKKTNPLEMVNDFFSSLTTF